MIFRWIIRLNLSALLPKSFFLLGELFPDINQSDPEECWLDREDYSIEFFIGSDDPVTCIIATPRGEDTLFDALRLVCEKLDCRAMGTSNCTLLDFDADPAEEYHQWIDYARQVIGSSFTPRGKRITVSLQNHETEEKTPRILRSTLRRRLRRQIDC